MDTMRWSVFYCLEALGWSALKLSGDKETASHVDIPIRGIRGSSINGTENHAKQFCALLTSVFPQSIDSLYVFYTGYSVPFCMCENVP